MRFMLLILAGLAVIIIAVVLLINGKDQTGPLQTRLSARLTTLQKMIEEGDKNIKDPDLRKLNSDVSIQVLSDSTTIGTALKSAGMKKPDKATSAAEADTSSFNSLRDAALNNRFDSTYRKTLAQKFESTAALMRELHDKTQSKKLRSVLSDAYAHFKQLEGQLANSPS